VGRRGLSLQERNPEPQIQDERAWKGSGRPIRGTCGSGSTVPASAKVPRRQWVRRTSIPAVETSPENFMLNMESVSSQVVPGSGSSCKWESVGTGIWRVFVLGLFQDSAVPVSRSR